MNVVFNIKETEGNEYVNFIDFVEFFSGEAIFKAQKKKKTMFHYAVLNEHAGVISILIKQDSGYISLESHEGVLPVEVSALN